MNKIFNCVILYLILLSSLSNAQEDSIHSISADIGFGYSRYLTTLDFPDLEKYGFSSSLKLMWHPEHLLSLGVESGYHYLYFIKSTAASNEFGLSGLEASMTAVPILFVSSMRIFPLTLPGLEVQAGGGIYFLFNHGKLFGSSIYSSLYSFGYHIGAIYLKPVENNLYLGGEFKYYYISKLQDSNITLKIILSYKFLNW